MVGNAQNNKNYKIIKNNNKYKLLDLKDKMYLHIAILTKSNYIITDNLKDFPMIEYDKAKLLNQRNFIDILKIK